MRTFPDLSAFCELGFLITRLLSIITSRTHMEMWK